MPLRSSVSIAGAERTTSCLVLPVATPSRSWQPGPLTRSQDVGAPAGAGAGAASEEVVVVVSVVVVDPDVVVVVVVVVGIVTHSQRLFWD